MNWINPTIQKAFHSAGNIIFRTKVVAPPQSNEKPHRATSTFFPPTKPDSASKRESAESETVNISVTPAARGHSTPVDQHLLNLVDLLDEIALLKDSEPGDCESLGIVESRLSDLIALSGGEIIRDTDWQPQRQRPVEVTIGQSSVPTVLSSRRSGLAIGDRIVRKQEVVISKSNPTTNIAT